MFPKLRESTALELLQPTIVLVKFSSDVELPFEVCGLVIDQDEIEAGLEMDVVSANQAKLKQLLVTFEHQTDCQNAPECKLNYSDLETLLSRDLVGSKATKA